MIFIILVVANHLIALEDLERNIQPFVLETKKIDIPGYPYAFNPSITRWRGRLLMSFRFQSKDQFGFLFLDENFNPTGKPQILDVPTLILRNKRKPKKQDPRLIVIQDRLYMLYNHYDTKKMYIAEVLFNGVRFFVGKQVACSQIPSNGITREKNWVPFDYEGNLFLIYSRTPHLILKPDLQTGICESFASTTRAFQWHWGELRGGTPALLVDDKYLAFFHSCTNMTTRQSDGKAMPHYFMGAYTFSPKYPFDICEISPEPIIGHNFYNGIAHKTWKPLRVVFPGGFVFDENYIWVVYGRQDHEVWMVKLDKKGLMNSLVPVSEIQNEVLE